MDIESLKKAYEAIEMLKALNLPVSDEQVRGIATLEKQYIVENVIPSLKKEIEPFLASVKNNFQMFVSYTPQEGISCSFESKKNESYITDDSSSSEEVGYRKKKYILRVKFPGNRVSCHKRVSKTFLDVVEYAGARNVERLGIMTLGINIVSTELHDNEKYRSYQFEVEPGLYVCTYCNTDRKLEIIKAINNELNLGLEVEKIAINGEQQDV